MNGTNIVKVSDNMGKEKYELDELIEMDIMKSLSHLELFLVGIPHMVKLMGIDTFRRKIGFTKPQYYRRIKDQDNWSISEIKKTVEIIANFTD